MVKYIDIYGFWQGLKARIKIQMMNKLVKEDELYIADISVSGNTRGMGIGTKLLEKSERYALNNGKKYLTLVVIEPNVRAKALYERYGFEVTKKQNIEPADRWFDWDFKAVYDMRKKIV